MPQANLTDQPLIASQLYTFELLKDAATMSKYLRSIARSREQKLPLMLAIRAHKPNKTNTEKEEEQRFAHLNHVESIINSKESFHRTAEYIDALIQQALEEENALYGQNWLQKLIASCIEETKLSSDADALQHTAFVTDKATRCESITALTDSNNRTQPLSLIDSHQKTVSLHRKSHTNARKNHTKRQTHRNCMRELSEMLKQNQIALE